MGLAIGIGNGILFTSQRGVSSIIPKLIIDICARATYCENKTCTTATLQKIENIQYTAPAVPVGLLASYPGASAAYSLRNLIDTTTNVVRVRRSSDNTEQNFLATQITDGTLVTFTGANDGFVTTWYDQSGNSFNANQTTATNQPQIVSGGSLITQNGKPSVYTPGSKNLNTGLVSIGTSGDISLDFFAVLNNQATGNSRHLLGLSNNTNSTNRSRVLFLSNDSSTTKSVRLYGGSIVYDNSRTGQLLFNTNYQGGGGAFGGRINGADLSVNSQSNQGLNIDSLSGFMLLAGDSSGGDPTLSSTRDTGLGYVQEAIFYLNDQASNRTGIETNINNEYNVYSTPTQGLLYDYPGASAAYSLRNLIDTTTNVVRVRRSSDNTEQNFTATQITDGTLVTFTGANDGFVTTWYDQSGNGRNAVQATALRQPKLVSSGVLQTKNSKPTLIFNKVNSSSLFGNKILSLDSPNDFCSFGVGALNDNNDIGVLFSNTSSSFRRIVSFVSSTLNMIVSQDTSVLNNIALENNLNLITSYRSGNIINGQTNGTELNSVAAENNYGNDRLSIGIQFSNNTAIDGCISEIIIYPTDQSSNITGIETNINNEYTIY